jgi:kelch-like protein 2/3
MSARRSGAGVGVLDNVLYAVGGIFALGLMYDLNLLSVVLVLPISFSGHDGPVVRKSVEVYDPILNVWKSVADMSTCRRNAGQFSVIFRVLDKIEIV